jgi:hypothetical protein
MTFGITSVDIVIVDRAGMPPVQHDFDHDGKNALVTANIGGGPLEIVDAQGEHHYPGRAVIGLHFGRRPERRAATVELWQVGYGDDKATPCYLVDVDQPDQAYPIVRRYQSDGNFQTLGTQLVEGLVSFAEVVGAPVALADLDEPTRAAVYHYAGPSGPWVEAFTHEVPGQRGGGERISQHVAGHATQAFIGASALNRS